MDAYLSLGPAAAFAPGSRRVVSRDATEILVLNLDGRVFAVDNVCRCVPFVVGHPRPGEGADPATHGGKLARLEHADVDGLAIRCPRHASSYDLRDGRPVSGGAEIGLNTYRVRERGGEVEVSLLSDAERPYRDVGG